jgi:hypothetical protein
MLRRLFPHLILHFMGLKIAIISILILNQSSSYLLYIQILRYITHQNEIIIL